MNEFDKKLFKSLNYFASPRLSYIIKAQKSNKREFRISVHEDVRDYAFDEGYLDADKRRLEVDLGLLKFSWGASEK